MTIKVAINGFGRIGRLVLRAILEHHSDIKVVAVNDLVDARSLEYLFIYDSVHGKFSGEVSSSGSTLEINGQSILVIEEKDPTKLPWKEHQVDFVIESTGHYCKLEDAQKHLDAGAKKVIISAPGKNGVPCFVMGVNHTTYDPKNHDVVSNASCTTNCLAPVTKVIVDEFGLEEGLMTTIHAVTATQPTVDAPSKKDLRGGRSAMHNIIPSSTGAAKAVAQCIPEVEGKLTGMAMRVPVIDVSVVDLTVKLKKPTSYQDICKAMQRASETSMKGILGYTEEPVVSSDFVGSTLSSIFDKNAGIALNDRFYKLVSWYDNESGYAHRVVDLLKFMASQM